MAVRKVPRCPPPDYSPGYRIQRMIADLKPDSVYDLDPSVKALKELLERDGKLNALCLSMFAEAKDQVQVGRAPMAYLAVSNIEILMRLFDYTLTRSPEWEEVESPDNLRGLPLNLILMVVMQTPSGLQLFRQADVNAQFKRILGSWARFLESPRSVYALFNSADGWLSPTAIAELESVANRPTRSQRKFTDIFECPDPGNPETLGFASWDAFFSRALKPGIRPTPREILLGDDDDMDGDGDGVGSAVLNACESRPWQIVRGRSGDHGSDELQVRLKGISCSVCSVLDNDPLGGVFARGTVYQAYLSALSYHRWHAPVSGVVRKIRFIEGTYFAQLPMSDILAMEKSQGYLATAASRAAIFIEAADPRIGLICFVAVGMGEVSSCTAAVCEGDVVQAGDELGSFHYGGSTHCLLFREGLDVRFEPGVEDMQRGVNVPVRSLLARCFVTAVQQTDQHIHAS